jgi:hypothetical protein
VRSGKLDLAIEEVIEKSIPDIRLRYLNPIKSQ